MHRSVSRSLVVLAFVLLTALPAGAAPRRDNKFPGSGILDRVLERIVTILEDIRQNIPGGVTPPPLP